MQVHERNVKDGSKLAETQSADFYSKEMGKLMINGSLF